MSWFVLSHVLQESTSETLWRIHFRSAEVNIIKKILCLSDVVKRNIRRSSNINAVDVDSRREIFPSDSSAVPLVLKEAILFFCD